MYLTATLDAATWGAELAIGDGCGRIHIVEPMGQIEDDPNLTDKKFPGNPTRSYRKRAPLRFTGEIIDWEGHAPEQLQAMKDGLARLAPQFPRISSLSGAPFGFRFEVGIATVRSDREVEEQAG